MNKTALFGRILPLTLALAGARADVQPKVPVCAIDKTISHSAELSRICENTKTKIGFPAFTVTTDYPMRTMLETSEIYTCLAVVIFDAESKKGLLSHFLAGNDSMMSPSRDGQYPRHDYLQYFKDRYFSDSPNNNLSVLLIQGLASSPEDVEQMTYSLEQIFHGARILTDDQPANCARRSVVLDATTGIVTIREYLMAFEKGYESTCDGFIMADVRDHPEIYRGGIDSQTLMTHFSELRKKYDRALVNEITWQLRARKW